MSNIRNKDYKYSMNLIVDILLKFKFFKSDLYSSIKVFYLFFFKFTYNTNTSSKTLINSIGMLLFIIFNERFIDIKPMILN